MQHDCFNMNSGMMLIFIARARGDVQVYWAAAGSPRSLVRRTSHHFFGLMVNSIANWIPRMSYWTQPLLPSPFLVAEAERRGVQVARTRAR
jgi:hypothetical protein